MIGYFCAIWIWNTFIVFLPSYLLHEFNISLAKMGFFASVPWIGGAIGSMSSGFVAGWVAKRFNLSPLKANQYLVTIYAAMAAVALISMSYVNHFETAVALMTFTLVFVSAINSSAWTMASEIAPPSMVSSVSSIQNFGGAFSPLAAGFIVDATGSYSLAFLSAGVIALLGGVSYLWIVDKPIEEKAKATLSAQPGLSTV